MLKHIADPWVKALRSGKFRQGRGNLVINDDAGNPIGYCCLGVLAIHVLGFDDRGSAVLHEPMRLQAGMLSDDGSVSDSLYIVIENSRYSSLAEANDGGESFESIANWIECNWQKL